MSLPSSPAVLTPPAEWCVGESVPAEVFAGMSADELLEIVAADERLSAWITAHSLAAIGEMARRAERDAIDQLGEDASSRARNLAVGGARESVVDELVLATGLGQRAVQTRVEVARGDGGRFGAVRTALAQGRMSWSRVAQFTDRTAHVDSQRVPGIAEKVLAPWAALPPDHEGDMGGLAVPQAEFSRRLSRGVAAARTAEKRHRDAVDQRDARAVVNPLGDGVLTVTGDAPRIAAAATRVDGIARRLRREGDSRTLAQLRSDVTLDLIQHGQLRTKSDGAPAELVTTLAPYATFAGALPPAHVDVSVSAATLLGLSREPGTILCGSAEQFLAADQVRRIAYRAGSTWRRIVTDPATGYMADYSTTRYEITGHLRERVFVRDRYSRVPGSTRPAVLTDTDHDIDHALGGTSSESNLSAKNRRGHNHKTHRRWKSDREPTVHGTITWTTPSGRTYVTRPHDYRDTAPTPWSMIREYVRSHAADPDPDDIGARSHDGHEQNGHGRTPGARPAPTGHVQSGNGRRASGAPPASAGHEQSGNGRASGARPAPTAHRVGAGSDGSEPAQAGPPDVARRGGTEPPASNDDDVPAVIVRHPLPALPPATWNPDKLEPRRPSPALPSGGWGSSDPGPPPF